MAPQKWRASLDSWNLLSCGDDKNGIMLQSRIHRGEGSPAADTDTRRSASISGHFLQIKHPMCCCFAQVACLAEGAGPQNRPSVQGLASIAQQA